MIKSDWNFGLYMANYGRVPDLRECQIVPLAYDLSFRDGWTLMRETLTTVKHQWSHGVHHLPITAADEMQIEITSPAVNGMMELKGPAMTWFIYAIPDIIEQ